MKFIKVEQLDHNGNVYRAFNYPYDEALGNYEDVDDYIDRAVRPGYNMEHTRITVVPSPAHIATYAPEVGWPAGGFLVTCPHGCNLGASAHAKTEAAALKRIELHKLATS